MRFDDVDKNLLILQEECIETAFVITKIFRFGIDNRASERDDTNRELLKKEIGDVLAMIDVVRDSMGIDEAELITYKYMKLDKLARWYGK